MAAFRKMRIGLAMNQKDGVTGKLNSTHTSIRLMMLMLMRTTFAATSNRLWSANLGTTNSTITNSGLQSFIYLPMAIVPS